MQHTRMSASALMPLAVLAVTSIFASCTGPGSPAVEAPRSMRPQIDLVNTAAYPEESYTVIAGDTPIGIARKLGLEYEIFAAANGFGDDTIIRPGEMLVVPRVRPRSARYPEAAGAAHVFPPEQPVQVPLDAEPALVPMAPGGIVQAVDAAEVTEVYRDYVSLGDVVIMENAEAKYIYSGEFVPEVAKGRKVSAGERIGTVTPGKSVSVSRFEK